MFVLKMERFSIEDIALAKLFKYLQRSNTSKEAGGILIGKQAKGREEYYLCDVSEPSHMDKRGRFSFVRNKVSAQRIINKKWHESNGILYCIFYQLWAGQDAGKIDAYLLCITFCLNSQSVSIKSSVR